LSDSEIPQVENQAHALLKITTWRERDFQIGVGGIKRCLSDFLK
jgi:hypothetical protein